MPRELLRWQDRPKRHQRLSGRVPARQPRVQQDRLRRTGAWRDIGPANPALIVPFARGAKMTIPDGAEAARPFLPTRDFEQSRAFYEALGFRKLLDSDVAIFAIGATSFL